MHERTSLSSIASRLRLLLESFAFGALASLLVGARLGDLGRLRLVLGDDRLAQLLATRCNALRVRLSHRPHGTHVSSFRNNNNNNTRAPLLQSILTCSASRRVAASRVVKRWRTASGSFKASRPR